MRGKLIVWWTSGEVDIIRGRAEEVDGSKASRGSWKSESSGVIDGMLAKRGGLDRGRGRSGKVEAKRVS